SWDRRDAGFLECGADWLAHGHHPFMGWRPRPLVGFPTRRAVEDSPGREVVREALEAVVYPGRDEQHVAHLDRDALQAHEERAPPASRPRTARPFRGVFGGRDPGAHRSAESCSRAP